MFKGEAQVTDIDDLAAEVQSRGGLIKQRYNSDILRGFAARLPVEFAEKLSSTAKNDQKSTM